MTVWVVSHDFNEGLRPVAVFTNRADALDHACGREYQLHAFVVDEFVAYRQARGAVTLDEPAEVVIRRGR